MATSTVEDYLKQIYLSQQIAPGELLPMGKVATAVGVVPGTATTMIKALADSGLVIYEPRSGVRLTAGGEQLALHVLRRHRLVELFLVKMLGLDWAEVHDEAEKLEHAISEKVLQRIDQLLEHPSVDPHGDPIPTAHGELQHAQSDTLLDCELNVPLVITRVLDQEPAFLNFANRAGLTPGAAVVVRERDSVADAVSVYPEGGAAITVGTSAAAKITVAAR